MPNTIQVERKGRVMVIRLNRPKALNALNSEVLADILAATDGVDADRSIGAIVLTGDDRAFAAGADIKEMSEKSYMDVYYDDFFSGWDKFAKLRTPKIAAVGGYALGGGCELAMMCDMIIAAESAQFGQPEIKLGVIPGMGGSQRMAHAVGKAKAMDLILTGRMMGAEEAERAGLVARVVPSDRLMEEAMTAAETIAGFSKPSTMVAKEAVDRAFEVSLAEGLNYERRTFFALFSTADKAEGMGAFMEKRKPDFKHE